MNLCVYAGTFNPIHTAHLIIAQFVKDEIGVDRVLFIPACLPPHRDKDIADSHHRFEMVKLAIADNESFDISDIEFQRQGKSYTYLTIQELYNNYPDIEGKINFIIGTDAFAHIDKWYESEKLVKMVKFVIFPREQNFDEKSFFDKIKLKEIDYQIVNAPVIDISSTLIRSRLKEGKSIKYLVNNQVESYIHQHKIFE